MEANHAQEQVERAFGRELSFYEILGVSRDASAAEIKSAYRRRALHMHPDKGGDEEKFKALCVIHSVLSDSSRRQAYDQCGEADMEDGMNSEESEFWTGYFRALFPKLTVAKIEEFSLQYKGGEEERGDVVDAYEKYKGDFSSIFESIMLAEQGDEGRVIAIIDEEILRGSIKEYPIYARHRKEVLATGGLGGKRRKDYDVCGGDDSDESPKKKPPKAGSSGGKAGKKGAAEEPSLEQLILRNRSSASSMADICAKYERQAAAGGRACKKGNKKKEQEEYDIDDKAFEAARARISGGKKR